MTGVRYDHMEDIDLFYQKAYRKAVTALRGPIKDIEVVMLTTFCQEVKDYKEWQRQRVQGASAGTFRGKQKYDAYGDYFKNVHES